MGGTETEDGALPSTLTLVFDEPLTFNGKQYTEVTVREPTTQQYADAADEGGIRAVQAMIATTGKLPKAVAALIPISKTMEADRFFTRFTRPAPQT